MTEPQSAEAQPAESPSAAEPDQAKNIILCSDGTGNAAGKRGDGTNVWKIFRAVDVHRGNDEVREQMAFYDDGVGTGNLKVLKALGGAFGWGLSRNIRDLYSVLVHHYKPGDRIFLFGFSRGAFTVRSLAGLICAVGVVRRDQTPPRPRLKWDWLFPWRLFRVGKPWPLDARVKEAFKTYRRAYRQAPPSRRGSVSAELERRDHRRLSAARSLAEEFRAKYGWEDPSAQRPPGCVDPHDIPIQCIGVWDTVDAVGLPVDELTDALDKLFRFKFHRYGLHRCVQFGFQALAIDDARHTFHPLLWDESEKTAEQRIEQVWFAGMHSNVGGGYPKDQMALVTLDWMMRRVGYDEQSRPWGVHFRPNLQEEWRDEATVHGKLYDSRSGLSAYYRYRPRSIEGLSRGLQGLDRVGRGALPKIHYSVLERIEKATGDYAPVNLPREFEIVDWESACPPWPAALEVEGGGPEVDQPRADGQPEPWWTTLGRRVGSVGGESAQRYWRGLAAAWDSIWLRRGLYFVFILLSLLFAWTANRLSSRHGECCDVGWSVLDPVFALAGWATPAPLASWIDGLKNNPFWLLLFLALAWLMLTLRARLIRRTTEIGTVAWRLAFGDSLEPPARTRLEAIAARIRSSSLSRGSDWFKQQIVPWIALLAALAGVFWLLWRLCGPYQPRPVEPPCGSGQVAEPLDPGESKSFLFETADPCHATDVLLEVGGRYLVGVATIDGEPATPDLERSSLTQWCDASFSASPAGLRPRADGSTCPQESVAVAERFGQRPRDYWVYKWLKLFRRSPWHDWFVLLGSVGTGDRNRHEIGSGPATIVPAATGRLYLYVNDAVCYVCPGGPWSFYRNNHGTAWVTVTREPD